MQPHCIVRLKNRIEINAGAIAVHAGKITALVKDVSDSATHTGAEIATSPAQDDDSTVGHVFTAMVADSFYHCDSPGVSNCKPFACDSVEVSFAACSPIQH